MRPRLRARTLLIAAVLAAGLAVTPAAQAPVKRVLIVHGGPESFPGAATFDAAIRQSLYSHATLTVEAHSEYLENEEFGEAASASLSEYIRLKFLSHRPDLVVVNTAPALQFVLRYRDELFPNVPVVFAAAALPPAVLRGEVAGITGILREPSQVETVEMALKIHPATRRLHVIAYAPEVEGFQQRVQATLAPFSTRLQITYSDEATLPDMLNTIRSLPADSLLFYVRYSPVTKGRVIFPDELLPEIAAAAPVPIYTSLDTNLGKGVVGGMMRNAEVTGSRLGELALRVLEGAAPERIPIEAARVRPVFDWKQLQRWNIAESLLPANSDIRFRVPSEWELYGGYIMTAVVVVIAQLVMITVLLGQRGRLRHAEHTIRARESSLRKSYHRIRHMAGRLINAQEAARADIARDLHDDVSQKLAYVSVGVNGLKNATGNIQDPHTQELFEELERETRNTFEGIRRLSHDLHPATLRLLGLAPALRSHCNEVAKRQGVDVQFSSGDNVGTVHPDVAVCFFRIAQEALRNGVMHGGAKLLTVRLARDADRLELVVTDDGRGFDLSAVQSNGGGLGLVTMEERANIVGGHVSITSAVGRGTTVHVRGTVEANQPAPLG